LLQCQFLYFNYAKKLKAKPTVLTPYTESGETVDQMPSNVMQVIEVQNAESRTITYVVVASESYLDIFALDIGNGPPQVVHQKKLKIAANTICCNQEEPSTFYISTKN